MTISKHTISIYNKSTGGGGIFDDGDTWIKTILTNCQFEDAINRNANTNGITAIDKSAMVIIPKTRGMKPYLEPAEYSKLPIDQRSKYFTLAAGDIIAKGDTPNIQGIFTSQILLRDYKAFTIKAVNNLSDQAVLPHWECQGI